MLSGRILREGMRIGAKSISRKMFGWKRYPGDASAICSAIVSDCWNGTHYQTSAGHFSEFYARDFGWCTEALVDIGYVDEAVSTLHYALERYKAHDSVRVAIAPDGTPFDFPDVYSPDTLAYLLRSLRMCGANSLVRTYRPFLEREIRRFATTVIDPKTKLVRRRKHFGSMKDYSIRDASCYDHTMAAAVSYWADRNHIENPLRRYDLADSLVTHYWNGRHFRDDLNDGLYVAADANVFPFWMGIVEDKRKLAKAIGAMQQAGLDRPFPMRYTTSDATIREVPFAPVVQNWELDAIWGHLGMAYIRVLSEVDRGAARKHLTQYKKEIERFGTFFEVYTPDGSRPYTSLLYHADEGMLWASEWLALHHRLR